jgi:hypothetical protein
MGEFASRRFARLLYGLPRPWERWRGVRLQGRGRIYSKVGRRGERVGRVSDSPKRVAADTCRKLRLYL